MSKIKAASLAAVGVIAGFSIADLSADSRDGALEEIIVTAKGREQSLFDVPLSITVLNEELIQQLGISTFDDLNRWVPALNIRTPSGRRQSTITMRGLSPNTNDERLRSVSIFVDGVYLSGSIASLRLQDLERVEVVRGPQATMFGRATYTGAIDLITKTPKVDQLTGRLGGGFSQYSSGNTSRYEINGRLDFPILQDRLWGSVSAVHDSTDSFAQTPSGSTGIGGEESTAIAALLYAEPTDNLSIKFRYNRSEDRDDTSFVHITHPDEWIAAGVETSTVGNNTIWPVGKVMNPVVGTTECQPEYGDGIPGSIGRGRPEDCGQRMERNFASWIVDYDLGDYALSYRGGYFRSFLNSNNDFRPRGNVDGLGVDPFFGPGNGITPGNKAPSGYISTAERYQNISQQLRIVSPSEAQLRWLAGLYYFTEKGTNFRTDNFNLSSSHTGSITDAAQIVDRGPEETENFAVFGQLEYDLTEQVTASFEFRLGRETLERKQCPDCRLASYPDQVGADSKETETDFLPRVTLTWKPDGDQTYYALYSEGRRSGRFNTSEPANFPGNFADFVYVRPEELKNYELGAKNSFADSRVQTSVALFYMDLKHQHQTAQLPDTTLSFTQNVGKSSVWGFEFETFAALTDRVSATLGVGYADHTYDTEFVPGSALDRRIVNNRPVKGTTSVGNPRTTINGGVQYLAPMMTGYELLVRVDASYRSRAYIDLANQAYVGANTRLNLLTTLSRDAWSASLYARNLNNDRTSPGNFSGTSTCTYTNPAFTTFNSALQRCSALGVSRGRELGVSAAWNF
ncbi:MAG: TonB-dependent receptor [Gammaproteobacteria bacterium]|nr:TonB-dependent receptor [Gammaproteobacteria bacterium]